MRGAQHGDHVRVLLPTIVDGDEGDLLATDGDLVDLLGRSGRR
jgi:hypothetical protein